MYKKERNIWMKKKIFLFSSLVLASSTLGLSVSADETAPSTAPVGDTTLPVPSSDTGTITPAPVDGGTTTPVETPVDDGTTAPVVETPPVNETPPSTQQPGGETTPLPSDSLPGSDESSEETSAETEPGSSGVEVANTPPNGGSDQPAKQNDRNPALPKDNVKPTVTTANGEKATLDTDKSKPTNNPNVTAEQALEVGASQVGTTSEVTGQVVSDVTSNSPLTLSNGVTITSIDNGIATLVDGSKAALTSLGATRNSDGTYSAQTASGEKVTLPETGDSLFVSALVSLIGLGFVGGGIAVKNKFLYF